MGERETPASQPPSGGPAGVRGVGRHCRPENLVEPMTRFLLVEPIGRFGPENASPYRSSSVRTKQSIFGIGFPVSSSLALRFRSTSLALLGRVTSRGQYLHVDSRMSKRAHDLRAHDSGHQLTRGYFERQATVSSGFPSKAAFAISCTAIAFDLTALVHFLASIAWANFLATSSSPNCQSTPTLSARTGEY